MLPVIDERGCATAGELDDNGQPRPQDVLELVSDIVAMRRSREEIGG